MEACFQTTATQKALGQTTAVGKSAAIRQGH